jgi:peptidylamidoglycolate lyase
MKLFSLHTRLSGCIVAFFVSSVLHSCYSSGQSDKLKNDDHGSEYQLVKDWPQLPRGYELSQPGGLGIDTSQNIFVFHRPGRKWKLLEDEFPDSLISSNTILMIDRNTGGIKNAWGAHLFIMPHGLTVDKLNNVWVTDVGLHQIFKFSHEGKLLMKLGVPGVPGNDSLHFNRPTDVTIAADGSFYVSDGYRNSRVVKFSKDGKYLFPGVPKEINQANSTFHMLSIWMIREMSMSQIAKTKEFRNLMPMGNSKKNGKTKRWKNYIQ